MDLRYLAGLFDGEGSIGIYRQKATGYRKTAGLTNTYKPILEVILQEFGGGLYPQRAATRLHKATWGWEIQNGPDIRIFLEKLRPFLIIKAEQADVMLACLYGNLDKDEALELLKKLKHAGKLTA